MTYFLFSFYARITGSLVKERESGSNESWESVPPPEMVSYKN